MLGTWPSNTIRSLTIQNVQNIHNKPFTGCENHGGLDGFYFSHKGAWYCDEHEPCFPKLLTRSEVECANTCKEDCRAFATNVLSTGVHRCYQYKTLVGTSKKVVEDGRKAYVKCKGNNDC